MLKHISHAQLIEAWCGAVIVLGACSIVGGTAITSDNGALWLAACVVPPAVMLLVRRGAPQAIVAEPPHPANTPLREGRS